MVIMVCRHQHNSLALVQYTLGESTNREIIEAAVDKSNVDRECTYLNETLLLRIKQRTAII